MMMSNRRSHTNLFSELGERHEAACLDFSAALGDLSLLRWGGPLLWQEVGSQPQKLNFHIVQLVDYLVKLSLCDCPDP